MPETGGESAAFVYGSNWFHLCQTCLSYFYTFLSFLYFQISFSPPATALALGWGLVWGYRLFTFSLFPKIEKGHVVCSKLNAFISNKERISQWL